MESLIVLSLVVVTGMVLVTFGAPGSLVITRRGLWLHVHGRPRKKNCGSAMKTKLVIAGLLGVWLGIHASSAQGGAHGAQKDECAINRALDISESAMARRDVAGLSESIAQGLRKRLPLERIPESKIVSREVSPAGTAMANEFRERLQTVDRRYGGKFALLAEKGAEQFRESEGEAAFLELRSAGARLFGKFLTVVAVVPTALVVRDVVAATACDRPRACIEMTARSRRYCN